MALWTHEFASTTQDVLANESEAVEGLALADQVVETADDVVKLIENERFKQGLSQRKICADAGLSHGAYWFIKHNRGGLKLDTAMRLLDAVGATVKVEAGS